MVALFLSLLLGALVLSVYLGVTRWIGPWQRAVTLENEIHLLSRRLTVDLAYAERLLREDGERWALPFASGDTVRYRHRDRALLREGRRMHAAATSVAQFRLVLSDEAVAVHLTMQHHAQTLSLTTAVMLRQPRSWPSVP